METPFPPVDPASMGRAGAEPPRERIVRLIASWIADRSLAPGTRLPPVREAALHFHVDKGTMVRAYRLLVERAIVTTTGRSTRTALVVPGSPAQALRRTLLVLTAIRGEELVARAIPGQSLALVHGILAAAHDAGWSVLFQHGEALADGPLPTAAIATSLLPGLDAALSRLAAARVPVAVYGDVIDRPDLDRVVSDHAAGVRLLVARLAALGRRRILIHLPHQHLPWMRGRLAGYRAGMAAAGLAPEPPLTVAAPDAKTLDAAALATHLRAAAGGMVEILTSQPPVDAVLGVSDGEAMALAAVIALFHRRIPEDVAVCGYDNYWPTSPERTRLDLPPPLLSVDKGNERIGRALVELVAARCAGGLPATAQEVVVAPTLVEGG